ncbi:MAG TPA: type II CAAX endopeptidase family protein [Bacillota bacterium]|nr:type II CAAX endopeptidase family protein [Bacillota bacterium]
MNEENNNVSKQRLAAMPVWLKKIMYLILALSTFAVHIVLFSYICSLMADYLQFGVELPMFTALRIYNVFEIALFILFTVLYYVTMRIFFIDKKFEMKDPALPRKLKLKEKGLWWRSIVTGCGIYGVSFVWVQFLGKVFANINAETAGFFSSLIRMIQEESAMILGMGGAAPGAQEIPLIDLLLYFMAPTIVMPIAEEFVFRGVAFNALEKVFPKWLPVIGSAIIFGVGHWSIVNGSYAFIMGIVFALLYKKTRNIFAVCIAHLTNNLMATIQDLIAIFTGKEDINRVIDWVCVGVAVVMVVVLFDLFRRLSAKKEEAASAA